ncbi:SDR family oxidoreductase, partial [Enterobacteriaceae bacterium ML5]
MSITPLKHALVTGCSSGIGETVCLTLLAQGWKVTGLARREASFQHPHFCAVPLDITDTAKLTAVLETLTQVDAVIHAAGMMKAAPLGQLDPQASEALWKLHIGVAEVLADRLVENMPDGGRIVLLGSRTSSGVAGRSQYVATKSAMIGMTRSWAAELAPRGITVNVVAPGATQTPMLDNPQRQSSPPRLPPIGRYIQPQDCLLYTL